MVKEGIPKEDAWNYGVVGCLEEACESAKDIKPKIVIPMHNWDLNLSDFKKIMEQKDPNIKVEILENRSLKL